MRRAALLLIFIGAWLVLPAMAASAHPLGNFTINTYSGIRVQPDRITVSYVVDRAEIPTFQERARIDIDHNGAIDAAEADAYGRRACASMLTEIRLDVGGTALAPRVTGSETSFLPGAAGLQTMRLDCEFAAGVTTIRSSRAFAYRDANFAGRVGWREITLVGDRTTVRHSTVPTLSVSAELTRYPTDLLQSPLDVREASAEIRPGGPAAARSGRAPTPALLPRGVDGATRAFTSFLARRSLTLPFAVAALAIAVALGAIHALAPGHGKTVMAAYLVGQRGTIRDGALIGLTVTATHTAGVLLLGLVLSVSTGAASERVYPILGLASGAMLAAMGAGLLVRAFRTRAPLIPATDGASHHHPHDHTHTGPAALSKRALAAMGLAGGLVPSPSAVIVLLGAIALGRPWLGVALVVAYGAGMALTLSGAGLLLARARRLVERRSARRSARAFDRLARLAPLVTAAVIVTVGITLAARGISQI